MNELDEKKRQAVWIARSLFERGKTSGTTANISFRHGGKFFISCSGSCFGSLCEEELVAVCLENMYAEVSPKMPSKELELHRILYESSDCIQAVIHVHSPSVVLWSCIRHENPRDVFPHDTPYLDMKLGNVVEVPYAPPGSQELFDRFRETVGPERGYLLNHHGGLVGGISLMNAFEAVEEMEQSAWLAWQLRTCREQVTDKNQWRKE